MPCPALISDHVGTNPIIISERNAQHSHLTMWEHIPQNCQKGPTLTFDHARNQSSTHVKKDLHLHSTMRGTNPSYMLKGLCTYIRPCEEPIQPTCQKGSTLTFAHATNQSSIHVRRALSPRLRIPGNWPGASIQIMAFNTYILSCRNQSYSHIRMAQHSHLTWKVLYQNPVTIMW